MWNGGNKDMLYKNELDEFINSININGNEICLIGGTSLLMHGIRNHKDIDISICTKTRNYLMEEKNPKYTYKSNGGIVISNNLEVAKPGVFSKIKISDDELIMNSRYHSFYKGLKVAKLELMYSKKLYKCTKRSMFRFKDLLDIYYIHSKIKEIGSWDTNLMLYQDTKFKMIIAKIIIMISYFYVLYLNITNAFKTKRRI